MKRTHRHWLAVALVCAASGVLIAADVRTFKCPRRACGFTTEVAIGGTMSSEAAIGWCHECKAFKTLAWTRKGSPTLRPGDPVVPPPKAVAEVWVPKLGQVRSVYRCPDCDGAFLEIREPSELTACPKCGGDQFQIDPAAKHVIVD